MCEGELCTPTGAALLTHFADEFGAMPTMTAEKIGYGMGKQGLSRRQLPAGVAGERAPECCPASRN